MTGIVGSIFHVKTSSGCITAEPASGPGLGPGINNRALSLINIKGIPDVLLTLTLFLNVLMEHPHWAAETTKDKRTGTAINLRIFIFEKALVFSCQANNGTI